MRGADAWPAFAADRDHKLRSRRRWRSRRHGGSALIVAPQNLIQTSPRALFRFRVAFARVASSWWPRRLRPASAVATRADAPEPRSFGPYALAAAAIKGFSPRHPSRVNTAWGCLTGPDHGAGDRREEDLRPAVAATLPGRAARVATADARRTHARQAAVVPAARRRRSTPTS